MASAPGQAPVTSVAAIRALPPGGPSRQVLLHGVVTTLSGWKNSFFFSDGTAGISVDRNTTQPTTRQGDAVEIHGHTALGLFAPIVIADSVAVIGKQPLPVAKLHDIHELAGGVADSQWVAVQGVVRSADVKQLWGQQRLVLSVDIGGPTLVTAVVHDFDGNTAGKLTAAVVRIQGVCGTMFNDHRQFVGVRLFVSSLADITVLTPAPKEPYDAPARSVDSLLRFRDDSIHGSQVRVTGTVTWSRPGEGLYIQDNGQGLLVQSGVEDVVPIGARVEAVGYPSVGAYSPMLQNSIFHIVGQGAPVRPIDARASEIIRTQDGFPSVPNDSVLVRVHGTLLEHYARGEEDIFLMQDGKTVFNARINRSQLGNYKTDDGTEFDVTGICTVNVGPTREPRSFGVLLRSADDLVVTKSAPWWNARHAWWAVGLLAPFALILLAAIAVLRREQRLQAMAVTDPLTNLYNRRGFLVFAHQCWQIAVRRRMPLLLFYIDLDHFKPINDNYGHKMGDQALLAVSGVLRECFRKVDVVGRMGGDEFAAVALDGSEALEASLRFQIDAFIDGINERNRFPFQIQLSLGVIRCDPTRPDSTIENCLERADAVMYEQKRMRRAMGAEATMPQSK